MANQEVIHKPVVIESSSPRRIQGIDLVPRGPVFSSPQDWRDHTLYFLLPDRFSDGDEGARPVFDRSRPAQFTAGDKAAWMAAGKRFTGGTLKGIRSKLGYLRDLGVTALWVGPVGRQCASLETYHGHGIQNFLEVDSRFGSRQDLVDDAQSKGLYVLLDVINNHSGDVFIYDRDGNSESQMPYRFQPPFQSMDGAVRPDRALPIPARSKTRSGRRNSRVATRSPGRERSSISIPRPGENPLHPDTEFRRGDFFGLKNLELCDATLSAIIDAYRYWIALTDCDGFRIDTVKHVPFEASRNFCGGIREYAETVGKSSFLLLGEVTGGSGMARDYLDIFGRNLDAALDIGDPARLLTNMAKGFELPGAFFSIFGGHDLLGSHREVGRYHVSILDDHDMVGRSKRRFSAGNNSTVRYEQVAHATAVQLTTLGIPCIYYGTEQAFEGSPDDHDRAIEPSDNGSIPFEDRYIRGAMFGGPFGAFRTAGYHFFDPTHPAYLRISAVSRVRNRTDDVGLTLRRGRSYLREISLDGNAYFFPDKGQVAAWSRILYRNEVVVCLNTGGVNPRGADSTIDPGLHAATSRLRLLYRRDWSDAGPKNSRLDQVLPLGSSGGRKTVHVELPAAGMMILSA